MTQLKTKISLIALTLVSSITTLTVNLNLTKPANADVNQTQSPVSNPTKLAQNGSTYIGDYYFLYDSAFTNVAKARQRLRKLQQSGYYNAGIFWIPDYHNLSGNRYYTVYVDKMNYRQDCANFLNSYTRKNKQAYCVFGSSNPAADPDRFRAGYRKF